MSLDVTWWFSLYAKCCNLPFTRKTVSGTLGLWAGLWSDNSNVKHRNEIDNFDSGTNINSISMNHHQWQKFDNITIARNDDNNNNNSSNNNNSNNNNSNNNNNNNSNNHPPPSRHLQWCGTGTNSPIQQGARSSANGSPLNNTPSYIIIHHHTTSLNTRPLSSSKAVQTRLVQAVITSFGFPLLPFLRPRMSHLGMLPS